MTPSKKDSELKDWLSLDKLQQDKSQQVAFEETVTKKEIEKVHREGFRDGIPCGLDILKDNFSWVPGYVYLFTGYPGSGKSYYVNFLTVEWTKIPKELLWKDLPGDNKICVYSPENYPVKMLHADLIQAYVGKPIEAKWGESTLKEVDEGHDYIKDKYHFMNFRDIPTLKVILDYWEERLKEGYNFFLIDPLNSIAEGTSTGSGGGINKYSKALFTQLKLFASNNNVIVACIEHPTRPQLNKDGEYPKVTVHSIFGGSNVFNKLDCIVILHREGSTLTDNVVEVETAKMKRQQLYGYLGSKKLAYDWKSHTYGSASSMGSVTAHSQKIKETYKSVDPEENEGDDGDSPW